jgi:hypothetical protein
MRIYILSLFSESILAPSASSVSPTAKHIRAQVRDGGQMFALGIPLDHIQQEISQRGNRKSCFVSAFPAVYERCYPRL